MQVEGPQLGGMQAMRSLPAGRVMQMQGARGGPTPPGTEALAPAPPVMFQTAAVPQMQAQESVGDVRLDQSQGVGIEEENEYLQARVQELENARRQMEDQLSQYRNAPPQQQQASGTAEEVTSLQCRLLEAKESEANALRAHEARLHEINELEDQIFRLRSEKGEQTGAPQDGEERMLDLQRQLANAKAAEGNARRLLDEQAVQLEEQSLIINQARSMQAAHQEQRELAAEDRIALEQQFASVQQEKESHRRVAEQREAQLREVQANQQSQVQGLREKIAELTSAEDSYQRQLVEDRRQMTLLEDQLETENKAKELQAQQRGLNEAQIDDLESEVAHMKTVETFHKGQSELHRKEAFRLKRLREEDAPPPFVPRMPLKVLEERVMHLACFMMLGLCALPIMGALAVLSDANYTFWMGRTWPWLIIGGCISVFVLFAFTMQGLLAWALPENRSQFTMAFTWATFAALLGVVLVPISLMANKEALAIAGTVSQGCMTALPQSEMLVDYSQVLYNIRLSPNCTNAGSVTECNGWAANKYTVYLEYLESDFHCGPLCPENPPPARAIVAPGLHNKQQPTIKPDIQPPPVLGPPIQNALRNSPVLLQASPARTLGVMDTALPHMQATRLFSKGETRMTCYPLIATRLQVLVSTFGGLWFWEGMGLIVISLLTSLYAGMYYASSLAA